MLTYKRCVNLTRHTIQTVKFWLSADKLPILYLKKKHFANFISQTDKFHSLIPKKRNGVKCLNWIEIMVFPWYANCAKWQTANSLNTLTKWQMVKCQYSVTDDRKSDKVTTFQVIVFQTTEARGYSPKVWWVVSTCTLFQIVICNFPHPISDLSETSMIRHFRAHKVTHSSNTWPQPTRNGLHLRKHSRSLERSYKFAKVDAGKKIVPCKQNTWCQARVKNIPYFTPK